MTTQNHTYGEGPPVKDDSNIEIVEQENMLVFYDRENYNAWMEVPEEFYTQIA